MINIEDFDSNLLKIDKILYKNIGICNIGYITIKKNSDYENIHSVKYFVSYIVKVIGYIEERNGSKYLVVDFTDKNKEILKKALVWD